jgi:hypothetical protein
MENNGVVGNKAKELTTMFDAQMKRLLGGPKGSLDITAHPSDVLDVMKSFEKRIAQKSGKGSNYRLATDETTNQANALRLVNDELQGRLESGADVKDVLTPDLRNKLVSLHPDNPQWQNYIDNKVMKAKDIKALRSAQAPFVNAKKIIDEADINSMTFGGRAGNAANGIKDALINAGAKVAKGPVARTAANGLKTASKVASNGLPALSLPPTVSSLPTGLRIGAKSQIGEGLVSALMGNQSSKSMSDNGFTTPSSSMTLMPPNMSTNTSATNQSMNTTPTDMRLNPQMNSDSSATPNTNNFMGTSYYENGNLSSTSPFDLANVEANIQKLVQSGATDKDIQNYLGIVSTLQDMKAAQAKVSGGTSLNSTQQQQANTALSGLDSLQEIASTLQSNPNAAKEAALPGGSLTARLTGTGSYKAATANLVDAIGRLRSGGAISADEQKNFMRFIPSAFDDKDTVAYKLSQLNSIFQRFAYPQPTQQDLTSALGA